MESNKNHPSLDTCKQIELTDRIGFLKLWIQQLWKDGKENSRKYKAYQKELKELQNQ